VASLHLLAAQVAVALALLAAAWGTFLGLTRRPVGRWYAGLLIGVGLLVFSTAVVGLVLALTAAPPRDLLHLLYGAAAAAVVPIAAIVARDQQRFQDAVVLTGGIAVLLGLALRLFQTGG